MTNNDVLRRIRYSLDIGDPEMLEIFRLGGIEIDRARLAEALSREEEEGYVECGGEMLGAFLDGLIVHKRGRRETGPGETAKQGRHITNNAILKKLRIALELKEDDMICVLGLAGMELSKHELTALFRKEGHKNYRKCGDQFLRNFLNGLALRFRG